MRWKVVVVTLLLGGCGGCGAQVTYSVCQEQEMLGQGIVGADVVLPSRQKMSKCFTVTGTPRQVKAIAKQAEE